MNHAEIMGESMDLLFGGLDTVAAMTGFIMRFLARHPAHRRQLVEDHTLLPKAVEELLRRHSVATVARRVLKDIEIDGVMLQAGDMVVLSTVMHAMDETLWPAPLSVDFNRPAQQIGTFGLGVHTCIGARLARSEVTIMLDEWLTHIPDFEIAAEDDGRGLSGAVNALSSLRLVWPIGN
jgi:cytochrome P450